jgi:hypothetical protein
MITTPMAIKAVQEHRYEWVLQKRSGQVHRFFERFLGVAWYSLGILEEFDERIKQAPSISGTPSPMTHHRRKT